MALNIAHPIEKKTSSLAYTQEFKNKFHITVNEPTQTHFSVQGVQTYAPEEIKAMKDRAERVGTYTKKEGKFLELHTYAIDDEIEFLQTHPPKREESSATIKPKRKNRLQSAKPESVKTDINMKKPIKPSIRTEMGRANQKTVKLTKQQEKLKKMEEKLSALTKQYKQHFGDELKPAEKNKGKENNLIEENNIEQNQANISQKQAQNEDFPEFQEDQGQQAFPQVQKPGKSHASITKHGDKDDSFEEVEWHEKSQPSSSRLKASTYSQRLGNAVHLIFD